MTRLIFNLLIPLFCTSLIADEPLLSNITRLTSAEMGFSRAGEAYFSPDGQKISFQGIPIGENNYQIYTLDLTTHELVKISQDAASCTCSFFHPNGNKMIYAASPYDANHSPGGRYKWDFTPYMNIYESNIDGSNPVALTSGEAYHAECAYSPDGSEIVYASNEDGHMNIYIMNSDGTNVRQITHTRVFYNGGPFFSPDGTKIVFRSDRGKQDYLQIYIMDTDGNNLVQLTDNDSVNWAPFWHPTGNTIAYTTAVENHSYYEIFLISTITNQKERVTYSTSFDGLPTFNKEGNKMLWTSKRGEDQASHIFVADFTLPEGWPTE